jgi:hypothetical protein
MSFFSNSQSNQLVAAVLAKDAELTQVQLQPYADALYNIIVQDVTARRDEIFNNLLKNIKSSKSIRSFGIPFWSYNVRYYAENKEDYESRYNTLSYQEKSQENIDRLEREHLIRQNGWHWTMDSVPVNVIIKKTDMCARLSAFFSTNFDMFVRPFATSVLYENDVYSVVRKELYLEYYPRGLNILTRPKVEEAIRKYENYIPDSFAEIPTLHSYGECDL